MESNLLKALNDIQASLCKFEEVLKSVVENDNEVKPTPLYKQILNQTEMYNGHGQMEISELSIDEIHKLLGDLELHCDSTDDMFYLKIYAEYNKQEGKYFSGSIYQDNMSGEDKLWLGIGKVVTNG